MRFKVPTYHIRVCKSSACSKCFILNLQYWNDEYLKWNTTDYPFVTNVNMHVSQIWFPNIDVLERYEYYMFYESSLFCISKHAFVFLKATERTVSYKIIFTS